MTWIGPMKTIVDIDGPDSPGAAAAGVYVGPGTVAGTQGFTSLAVAASNPLPPRPVTASAPSAFIYGPSGNLTQNTTYVAQVPGSPTPGVGGYYPGDLVRLIFTAAQLATFNVTVDTAPSTAIGAITASKVTTAGYIDIQLNQAGLAWNVIGGGAF